MLETITNTGVARSRAASKIKEKMEKMPKHRKNKDQLEGDQE